MNQGGKEASDAPTGDTTDALVANQGRDTTQTALRIAVRVEQCDIDTLVRVAVQVEFRDHEAAFTSLRFTATTVRSH